MEVRDYQRVVDVQNNGAPATEVAKMISQLPESYKPDENDLIAMRKSDEASQKKFMSATDSGFMLNQTSSTSLNNEDTNTANIVSTQHLINVTDFSDPHMMTQTTLGHVSNNDRLANYRDVSKIKKSTYYNL